MINKNNPFKSAIKGFSNFHNVIYNEFVEVYKEKNLFISILFTVTLPLYYPVLLFAKFEELNTPKKKKK